MRSATNVRSRSGSASTRSTSRPMRGSGRRADGGVGDSSNSATTLSTSGTSMAATRRSCGARTPVRRVPRRETTKAAWVGSIRPYTCKPIVGVGRFTNPDTMVEAIRGGPCDVIGAARPTIADPFLPQKIEEGRRRRDPRVHRLQRMRAARDGGRPIVCTQNATSGEEYRRGWHPENGSPGSRTPSNDVLVVGAGPAGMECAIVLAEARHGPRPSGRGRRRIRADA